MLTYVFLLHLQTCWPAAAAVQQRPGYLSHIARLTPVHLRQPREDMRSCTTKYYIVLQSNSTFLQE